jgi:protein TonB
VNATTAFLAEAHADARGAVVRFVPWLTLAIGLHAFAMIAIPSLVTQGPPTSPRSVSINLAPNLSPAIVRRASPVSAASRANRRVVDTRALAHPTNRRPASAIATPKRPVTRQRPTQSLASIAAASPRASVGRQPERVAASRPERVTSRAAMSRTERVSNLQPERHQLEPRQLRNRAAGKSQLIARTETVEAMASGTKTMQPRTTPTTGSVGESLAASRAQPRPLAGNPQPSYPRSARRRGHEGRVILEVVVGTTGDARQVAVIETSGFASLDRAAERAVKRWRFTRPAASGSERIRIPVVFRLQARS